MADLGAVYLLLGHACNMTCRHCTQIPVKDISEYPAKKSLSQETYDFIVNWARLPNKFSNKRRLYFWGGEPLLYWDTIVDLITRFDKDGVDVSYRIFSNGLLLSQDIVDFCNKHNVYFILSHDAPNALAVRNVVPNDTVCNLFLQIQHRTVNTVFNAINNDMAESFRVLEKKFPDTEISCGFINVLSDIPKDIWDFKPGEVKKSIDGLRQLAESGDRWAAMWFISKFNRSLVWDPQEFADKPYPPCRPGMVSLSIDFDGNVIRCHNDGKILASINEPFEAIQRKHLEEWQRLLPPKCKECPAVSMCRCICPIAKLSDDKTELCYCNYLREMWGTLQQYLQGVDN